MISFRETCPRVRCPVQFDAFSRVDPVPGAVAKSPARGRNGGRDRVTLAPCGRHPMSRYDAYVHRVQRIGPLAGAVAGAVLGFAWGAAKIGLGAGILFAACGAFAGLLLASI